VIIEQNFVSSSRLRSGIVIGNAYGAETRNITIRNNVFVDNAEFGIWLTGENTRDVNVYNNTVYGNGDAGIAFRSDMRNVSIKNNIIANNAGRHINNSQGAMNVLVDCNLYFPSPMNIVGVTDSQPVFGDPLFAAAGLGDFHLTSKSPAIDAGIDVGLPFVGTAPDLGAFEFSSGPSEVKKNDDPTRMTTFNLRQNYPNPFNPTTSMQIEVPVVARIKLSIYDIQGKLVRAVANGSFQPGLYKIPWNGQDDLGRDMPSGIYFCVLYAKDQNGRLLVEQTQRMILLR
jgi:parallel beta-helix repeat protein